MKHLSFFILAIGISQTARLKADEKLTIERLFSSPELAGKIPRGLKFSDDGRRLVFLRGKAEDYQILDLWEFDLVHGEPRLLVDSKSLSEGTISEEEKARRERLRIHQSGIVEFKLSQDGKKILFPIGGDLYFYSENKIKRLTETKGAEIDAKFSPKDHFVSYVRDQNIYVLDPKTKKEFPVTRDGKGNVSYGVAEFIAQEEMDRFTGYWWSKDETYLALVRVDESAVKEVSRYEIEADQVKVRKERYPETGTANAKIKLGVVRLADIKAGRPHIQWLPLADTEDFYLPRVEWTPKGRLTYQIQTRDQKNLTLFEYDPQTKKRRMLLTEVDPHWIHLHGNLRFLEKAEGFIWSSPKSGFNHLYLHRPDGEEVRPLTQGDWNVDSVEGVDEEGGWVYFTATLKSALEKHLYRTSLKNFAPPEALTKTEGWHGITMTKDGAFYLDRFSSSLVPPQLYLHNGKGERIADLGTNEVKEGHPLFPYVKTLVAPEFGTFAGPSGEIINYRMFRPEGFDKKKKYPLIVLGYGGPGHQVVTKAWSGLTDQILVNHGFLVASFDNRGSPRRGKKFENALYHAVGTVEVEDQTAGVKFLMAQGFVDPKRVGFMGWSYGGYLALMLAAKAADVFTAVAAVAPVTSFGFYDTHYTERYLGKPQEDPEAYRKANVLEFVSGIKGRVLVMHGMADDNVLFTNSTMLFKKLQDEGKLYESVTYPGAKHGISGRKNQIHVWSSILDFFERSNGQAAK